MTSSVPFVSKSHLTHNVWVWMLAFACALSLAAGCVFAGPAFAQDGAEEDGYANFIIDGIADNGFTEPGATLVISIDKFCENSSVFAPAAEAGKLEVAIQATSPTTVTPESLGSFGSGVVTYTVPPETIYLHLRLFFQSSDSATVSVQYRIPCIDLTCGDSAQWDFNPLEGALTISGSGAMRDYESAEEAPWHGFRESVKRLSLQDGIASVGSYAFCGMSNLTEVSFPSSMQEIRSHAFQGSGLGFIEDPASSDALNYVELPESVDWICEYAFADCGYLNLVLFQSESVTIDNHAFENCCTSYPEETGRRLVFVGYANHEAGNLADYAMKNNIPFLALNGDLGSTVLDISGSGVAFKEEIDDLALNALFSTLLASGVAELGSNWVSPDGENDPDSGCDWIDLDADGTPDILRTIDKDYNTVIKKAKGCNLSGSVTIELSDDDRWEAAMNNKYRPDGFYYGKLIVRFTIIPLTGAKVSVASSTYNGKPQKPSVIVQLGGKRLEESVDFTVAYADNVNAGKNAKVTVTGINAYSGSVTQAFAIAKAAGAFDAKLVKKTRTAKSSKKTVIKAKKAFKVTQNKGKGKVTYKKLSGNAKISVSKTGKITVRKGLKKGKTYPVKVKLTCAETSNYKKATKNLTLKIKVK